MVNDELAKQEKLRRQLKEDFSTAVDLVKTGQAGLGLMGPGYLHDLLQSAKNGVSTRQLMISFTKWVHSFNVTDVNRDLAYMAGEFSEVLKAYSEEGPERVVEELADVAIYCYGIAQMFGYDLDDAIDKKMKYNLERSYYTEE